MPTASSSISSRAFCSADFVASTGVHQCDRPGCRFDALMRMIRSAVLATETTCRPRPRPERNRNIRGTLPLVVARHLSRHPARSLAGREAVSEHLRTRARLGSPGERKQSCQLARSSGRPQLTVRVVNSYAPTLDSVLVVFDNRVDLPTEGKPIRQTRASVREIDEERSRCTVKDIPPDFRTSKPSPLADFLSGSRSWARYLAT